MQIRDERKCVMVKESSEERGKMLACCTIRITSFSHSGMTIRD